MHVGCMEPPVRAGKPGEFRSSRPGEAATGLRARRGEIETKELGFAQAKLQAHRPARRGRQRSLPLDGMG